MPPHIRTLVRLASAVLLLQLACTHGAKAPPIGNRDPDAQPDPDYPEVNCKLYTTVDCRTGGGR